MAQSANFFLESIVGWQTYGRLKESISLDYSQWKERIFVDIPMGVA